MNTYQINSFLGNSIEPHGPDHHFDSFRLHKLSTEQLVMVWYRAANKYNTLQISNCVLPFFPLFFTKFIETEYNWIFFFFGNDKQIYLHKGFQRPLWNSEESWESVRKKWTQSFDIYSGSNRTCQHQFCIEQSTKYGTKAKQYNNEVKTKRSQW